MKLESCMGVAKHFSSNSEMIILHSVLHSRVPVMSVVLLVD